MLFLTSKCVCGRPPPGPARGAYSVYRPPSWIKGRDNERGTEKREVEEGEEMVRDRGKGKGITSLNSPPSVTKSCVHVYTIVTYLIIE